MGSTDCSGQSSGPLEKRKSEIFGVSATQKGLDSGSNPLGAIFLFIKLLSTYSKPYFVLNTDFLKIHWLDGRYTLN